MLKFITKTYPPVPNMPVTDLQTQESIQNLWYTICDLGRYIDSISEYNDHTLWFGMSKLNARVECIGVKHIIRLWYIENKNNK